ncbi:MAG: glycosyltransferase family 2 protein [Alphaproteobacteria bacterium]|nr:glycosyltransferase family 2 protein [Alphaproteobacteria bacterium]
MSDSAPRVSVVTVTYNSAAVIEPCLASLRGVEEVIVVDNASRDDTLARARQTRPDVHVIASDTNLGFGVANNRGAAAARGDYVLFLNPDAVLADGALTALTTTAASFPEAVLLGPRIENRDGRPIVSHDADLLTRRRMGAAREAYPATLPDGPCCSGFLSGAALFARRSALPKPAFDERLFLYFEDDDLCLRLWRAGMPMVYVPEAVVRHLGGAASRPSPGLLWRKHWHMAWSRLYFERKHVGFAAAHALAFGRLAKFGAKALLYLVSANSTKCWRDAARFVGTLAFVLGVSAR